MHVILFYYMCSAVNGDGVIQWVRQWVRRYVNLMVGAMRVLVSYKYLCSYDGLLLPGTTLDPAAC